MILSKKEKRRRKDHDRQMNRERAMLHVEDIKRAALERGVQLRISFITGPLSQSPHWQFRDSQTAERLLDWWPSTGRWWSAHTGKRGRVADPWQALVLASNTISSGGAVSSDKRPDGIQTFVESSVSSSGTGGPSAKAITPPSHP